MSIPPCPMFIIEPASDAFRDSSTEADCAASWGSPFRVPEGLRAAISRLLRGDGEAGATVSPFMGISIAGALFGVADPALVCDLSWPIIAEWFIVSEEEGDADLTAPPICMPAMSCVLAAWFVGAGEVFGGSGAIFDISWPIDE